jgi:hypothetical protein
VRRNEAGEIQNQIDVLGQADVTMCNHGEPAHDEIPGTRLLKSQKNRLKALELHSPKLPRRAISGKRDAAFPFRISNVSHRFPPGIPLRWSPKP